MNAIGEKFWDWLRTVEYGVLTRWAAAIFVIAVWVHPYAKAVAEETVLQILKDKGFTVEDFKGVQKGLEDVHADVGAVKGTINNINNTLTERSATFNGLKEDVEGIHKDVDRLVDYIINKKTDRENYPQ
ncbi:MAG: hypothetical protein ABL936_00410 [Aestuariivirga sp.]